MPLKQLKQILQMKHNMVKNRNCICNVNSRYRAVRRVQAGVPSPTESLPPVEETQQSASGGARRSPTESPTGHHASGSVNY